MNVAGGFDRIVADLICLMDRKGLRAAGVIPWGSPVPCFGDAHASTVATLGLNPSNLEFVDSDGIELVGHRRRFETLGSLKLESWRDARSIHRKRIWAACSDYFYKNPYDRWFKPLDSVLARSGASFYGGAAVQACHLDLVPFATVQKWSDLSSRDKKVLIGVGAAALGTIVATAPIVSIVLNGATVVRSFEVVAGVTLHRRAMRNWSLPRAGGQAVAGYSFTGIARSIGGVPLGKDVRVFGYNHNIQSSFGVTRSVIDNVSSWLGSVIRRSP